MTKPTELTNPTKLIDGLAARRRWLTGNLPERAGLEHWPLVVAELSKDRLGDRGYWQRHWGRGRGPNPDGWERRWDSPHSARRTGLGRLQVDAEQAQAGVQRVHREHADDLVSHDVECSSLLEVESVSPTTRALRSARFSIPSNGWETSTRTTPAEMRLSPGVVCRSL